MKLKWLASPWAILASILIGILLGNFAPHLARNLKAYGELYLSLLNMCILPLLFTAVTASFARITLSHTTRQYLRKILVFMCVGLVVASSIGITVAYYSGAGSHLSPHASHTIGKLLLSTKDAQTQSLRPTGFSGFIFSIIPSNIFVALAKSQNLAVLFFATLLGIALGQVSLTRGTLAIEVVDTFYEAMIKIINGVILLLPIGLVCIFASEIATVGSSIFFALEKFIIACYISGGTLLVGYLFLLSVKTKTAPWRLLAKLKAPLLIGLSTGSSLAAIPSMVDSLSKVFRYERQTVSTLVPISLFLNPQASACSAAITTVFLANLYGVHLGLSNLGIILFGSIFAGIASSGAPGIAALAMFSIVLDPLGLPVSAAIVLITAVTPITSPFSAVLNILGNVTAISYVAPQHE